MAVGIPEGWWAVSGVWCPAFFFSVLRCPPCGDCSPGQTFLALLPWARLDRCSAQYALGYSASQSLTTSVLVAMWEESRLALVCPLCPGAALLTSGVTADVYAPPDSTWARQTIPFSTWTPKPCIEHCVEPCVEHCVEPCVPTPALNLICPQKIPFQ